MIRRVVILISPSKICAIFAVMALATGSAADAKRRAAAPAPRCWTIPQITAAKVNELSILLNVQSLRCRNVDTTIQDQYEAFKVASQSTIKQVSSTVKGHFGGSDSAYDRYSISLANKYGAGIVGQSCPDVATLMQSGIANGKSFAGLSQVAEAANIYPLIKGGACSLKPSKPFVATKRAPKKRYHK